MEMNQENIHTHALSNVTGKSKVFQSLKCQTFKRRYTMKLEFSEGYAMGFQTKKNFHERIWILILLKQHEKVEGHGSDGKLRV